MYQPVKAGFGDKLVTDHIVPVLYRELGADDQPFLTIPVIDELLEVVLLLYLQFLHPEVVDNQEIGFCKLAEEPYGMTLVPNAMVRLELNNVCALFEWHCYEFLILFEAVIYLL